MEEIYEENSLEIISFHFFGDDFNDIFVNIKNPNKYAVHLTYKIVGEKPPTPRSAIDIFEFQPIVQKLNY